MLDHVTLLWLPLLAGGRRGGYFGPAHCVPCCELACFSRGPRGKRVMLSRRRSALSQSADHSWRRYSDWRVAIR